MFLRKYSIKTQKKSGVTATEVEYAAGDGNVQSGLRCTFKIETADLTRPQVCDLRIHNVMYKTVKDLEAGDTLIVEAGYEDNYGVIFKGSILQSRFGRVNNIDTYFDIRAECAYGIVSSNMNAVVEKGVKVSKVIKDIVEKIASDNNDSIVIDKIDDDYAYVRGKTVFGRSINELTALSTTSDLRLINVNGEIELYGLSGMFDDKYGDAVVLSAATGMIGRPQLTLTGFVVKALINPTYRVGKLLKIEKSSIDDFLLPTEYSKRALKEVVEQYDVKGVYRIVQVSAVGDTRGNDWYHTLMVVEKSGIRPVLGKALALERAQ